MPRWLLPWLFPVGLIVVVVAIAISTILAIVLAVVGAVIGVPFVYRAYQANRPGGTGDAGDRRDPPNNRSLLR